VWECWEKLENFTGFKQEVLAANVKDFQIHFMSNKKKS
jgi:hypothetical protein